MLIELIKNNEHQPRKFLAYKEPPIKEVHEPSLHTQQDSYKEEHSFHAQPDSYKELPSFHSQPDSYKELPPFHAQPDSNEEVYIQKDSYKEIGNIFTKSINSSI
jgi:hypothetical protein